MPRKRTMNADGFPRLSGQEARIVWHHASPFCCIETRRYGMAGRIVPPNLEGSEFSRRTYRNLFYGDSEPAVFLLPIGNFQGSNGRYYLFYQGSPQSQAHPCQPRNFQRTASVGKLLSRDRHNKNTLCLMGSRSADELQPMRGKLESPLSRESAAADDPSYSTRKIAASRVRHYSQISRPRFRRHMKIASALDRIPVRFQPGESLSIAQKSCQLDFGISYNYNVSRAVESSKRVLRGLVNRRAAERALCEGK